MSAGAAAFSGWLRAAAAEGVEPAARDRGACSGWRAGGDERRRRRCCCCWAAGRRRGRLQMMGSTVEATQRSARRAERHAPPRSSARAHGRPPRRKAHGGAGPTTGAGGNSSLGGGERGEARGHERAGHERHGLRIDGAASLGGRLAHHTGSAAKSDAAGRQRGGAELREGHGCCAGLLLGFKTTGNEASRTPQTDQGGAGTARGSRRRAASGVTRSRHCCPPPPPAARATAGPPPQPQAVYGAVAQLMAQATPAIAPRRHGGVSLHAHTEPCVHSCVFRLPLPPCPYSPIAERMFIALPTAAGAGYVIRHDQAHAWRVIGVGCGTDASCSVWQQQEGFRSKLGAQLVRLLTHPAGYWYRGSTCSGWSPSAGPSCRWLSAVSRAVSSTDVISRQQPGSQSPRQPLTLRIR